MCTSGEKIEAMPLDLLVNSDRQHIMAVGHAFLGSAYLSCLLLFSTLVLRWRTDITATGKLTTVSSRAVDLRVWNPLINGIIIHQTNLTLLPMIRFCHSSIRYNTKFFRRRVTYYAGNLALYNTSVITLEFFTSWDVQLNPGPMTVQLGSSGRRPSLAINSQSKSYSSALINARSLKSFCKHNSGNVISNLTAFQNFVYHEDLDIVCVTETWLNDSIRDSEILPYNYTTFRQDRCKNRVGGGVLISVKSSSFKADVSMFPTTSTLMSLKY